MTNYNSKLRYSFPDFDSEALAGELILFIAEKSLDDPHFGSVKLNKILYAADSLSYRLYGEPITGAQYMRLEQGFVFKPMLAIIQSLEDRNRCVVVKRKVIDYDQKRVVAISEPKIENFKPRDIALVDEIIRVNWGKTAREMSQDTHGLIWKITKNKDIIPYEAMLLSNEGITEDDIVRAQELIEKHGWDV